METTAPYTLTVSNADITAGAGLPATFDRAISVRLTTADYEKELRYVEYRDLLKRHPDLATADTGTPTMWYKFANTIKVFPEPDIAYTLSLDYYKTPTELSDDADVPEIPSLYEELLVIGAYLRALEHDDDYDEAAVQRLLWDQKHINMVRKTTQKHDGPSVIAINRRRTTRIRG